MTGSQLRELQPTDERLGLIEQVVKGGPEPVCEVVAGNIPGTAIVQTAPFDDAFYSHERLAVLEYDKSNEEELSVAVFADKDSVVTREPSMLQCILQAVAEAENAASVTVTLAEGTKVSEAVVRQIGDRSMDGSGINFKVAA